MVNDAASIIRWACEGHLLGLKIPDTCLEQVCFDLQSYADHRIIQLLTEINTDPAQFACDAYQLWCIGDLTAPALICRRNNS